MFKIFQDSYTNSKNLQKDAKLDASNNENSQKNKAVVFKVPTRGHKNCKGGRGCMRFMCGCKFREGWDARQSIQRRACAQH